MDTKTLNKWMRESFELARQARDSGNGAYGAVIVDESGECIAKAGNTSNDDETVIHHAEINAIRKAEKIKGKGKLKGCSIYSSAEPCPMCASAIAWSGIENVCYGASIQKLSEIGIPQIEMPARHIFKKAKHSILCVGPLHEKEAIGIFDA